MGRLKLIKTCPIFKDLSALELVWLASSVNVVVLKKGQLLFEEGAQDDCAYIMIEGEVEARSSDSRAASMAVIFSAGDTLANSGAFASGKRRVSATVVSDSATLIVVGKKSLERLLKGHPQTGLKALQLLQDDFNHRLDAFLKHDSP